MLGTDQVLNKGRYRIIGAAGQDASDSTYEAYDTVSETHVVLRERVGVIGKVASASQIEAVNAAFAGEAKFLTSIRHESLVSVQDYFSEIDRQYLVLESVTGQSLVKYVDQAGSRPELAEVLTWMEQILAGLQYLHKLMPPVIHADVRPENIKLTADGHVKLLMTQVTKAPASKPGTPSADDTAFHYKPLEQIWPGLDSATQRMILDVYDERSAVILLRPVDARTDIYSTGASFYHVLTGTLPADSLARSIAILDGKPDPLVRPVDLNASIPHEISDALMRALAIRRENRFDVAAIMSQALRTAVIKAKERESIILEMPEDKPNTAMQAHPNKIPMTPDSEPDFDPTSPEAQLQLRQQLAEDRQREIEAEQARLEEERNKIEQRRLELEAEKNRHAAERERLRKEAEEARQRAEQERKRLEKERLEREAAKERERISEKLAVLAAERERERAEQARREKEAEAERRRAEQRLQELQAEQELRRIEQEKAEQKAKSELERIDQRLLELSGTNLDVNEPDDVQPTAPAPEPKVETVVTLENTAAQVPHVRDDVTVPDFTNASAVAGRKWHVPIIAGAGIVLVGVVAVWMNLPPIENGIAPAAVQQSVSVHPQTEPPVTEPSPAVDQPQAASQDQTANIEAEPPASEQKHQQVSSVPEKQKKPAVAKPATEKKKVTVDDLINDN